MALRLTSVWIGWLWRGFIEARKINTDRANDPSARTRLSYSRARSCSGRFGDLRSGALSEDQEGSGEAHAKWLRSRSPFLQVRWKPDPSAGHGPAKG